MESQLPGRARQRLPGDGEPGQPVGHEPGRARRLGQGPRRRHDRRPGRAAARRVPLLGRLRRLASTTRTRRSRRRWPSCCARAGIDVAILGPSEMCTGDSARRSGNEYLFQMLAMPNIEMLNGMGVKKIITQCPHCFNTLLNEYPQLGGNYEVVHHTPAARAADRRRPARRQPGDARGADHVPRLLLPRSPQRRVPRAAQGGRLDQGHRGRRDAAQRHQGHVLRRRRGADVDGGVDRHQGQRRAGRGGAVHRRHPGRHRLPVLLHHARRRREGRRGRGGPGQGRRHRRSTCSTRSRPASDASPSRTLRWGRPAPPTHQSDPGSSSPDFIVWIDARPGTSVTPRAPRDPSGDHAAPWGQAKPAERSESSCRRARFPEPPMEVELVHDERV